MVEAPSGTVTFLFTDIEGSTRLWQEVPEAMQASLARHDELLRAVFDHRGGRVFATGGDGFAVAFARAADAIAAATDVLDRLGGEPWPPDAAIKVRIGVHTGEAIERDGDFFGSAVNRTARLMALAHGGQALCSDTTLGVVEEPPSTLDLGEHRLRDLLAPVRVHQLGSQEFPPLRSSVAIPSNLPSPATELIGRDEEVAALVAELATHRLVTITGVGGMGKTRLAVEVAGSLAAGFADGVWFVDLAPTIDGGDVARGAAAAMGATAASSSVDALAGHLEGRRTLLVLDNCEHVIDAVAELVAAVLARAPQVSMVATSREPLDVAGEHVQHLRPLGLPDADAFSVAVGEFPAVRLFEQRARAARAGFGIDADNVADVVEICRRLDGVPLAIELAAARVGAMSVSDIRARLGERFRLLAGARRGHERHRTLQAAVAWSYDLLDPEEQRVFRSLSVFTGGFGMADAVAVVSGPDADEYEVLDHVTRLVDRSLVVHDGDTGRYRLLETLRQYGDDRLAEAGEIDAVRERFIAHYVELARREGPRVPGPSCRQARVALADAFDCLRAAAEWLGAAGRLHELAGLVTSMWWFLSQEAPAEAVPWLGPVLDPDADVEPQALYDALWAAAPCALIAADIELAFALDERLRLVWDQHDGLQESPWAHHVAMTLAAYVPDETSPAKCQVMVESAERCGDPYAAVFARSMAILVDQRGDPGLFGEIEQLVADALALGSPMWLGVVLGTTTPALVRNGVTPANAAQVIGLVDGNPGWRDAGSVVETSCHLLRATALTAVDPASAVRGATECVRLADRTGQANNITNGLSLAAYAAGMLGSDDLAARLHRHIRATALFDNAHDAWLRAETRRRLAEAGFTEDELTAHALTRPEVFDTLAELAHRHQMPGD